MRPAAAKLQLFFRYLLALCAVGAACYALVLARAEWLFEEDTANSVPASVRLAPYNARYVARLAAWRTSQKAALLERAVELNPFDSESLIQLGFLSEFQSHDNSAAETYFLRAAAVNKMFLPKWTLTNFYFRHGRANEFFRWARATLSITPYSPEPVFVQLWLFTQDPARIAAAIPDRPRILLPYAWFLSNAHQYAPLPAVIDRLISAVGKGDPRAWGRDDLIAAIEDRLVSEGESAPALLIWRSLSRAGWIAHGTPAAAAPVTNGDFHVPFYGHGFDWIPVGGPGLRINQSSSDGLVRLTLSGDQLDSSVLLEQYVPLYPGRQYWLRWRAESQTGDTPSGLAWHLLPVRASGSKALFSGDVLASADGGWLFVAPVETNLAALTLEYVRPLGKSRFRGTIILRSVSSSTK